MGFSRVTPPRALLHQEQVVRLSGHARQRARHASHVDVGDGLPENGLLAAAGGLDAHHGHVVPNQAQLQRRELREARAARRKGMRLRRRPLPQRRAAVIAAAERLVRHGDEVALRGAHSVWLRSYTVSATSRRLRSSPHAAQTRVVAEALMSSSKSCRSVTSSSR